MLLLYVLGMSFNIMTLGGIAAAIGLLIDDAIVMIEQIARRAGVPGLEEPEGAVLRLGAGIPLAAFRFEPGDHHHVRAAGVPVRRHRRVLQVSVADDGLVADHFIRLTALVVPLLARRLIDFQSWHDPAQGRETWLTRTHRRALNRCLRARG